jgi:hypothetical protein
VSWRKILIFSLSSKTLESTLPFDNYRTSVWKSKYLCTLPISSHKTLKRREFSERDLIKLTTLTTCFISVDKAVSWTTLRH